MSKNEVETSREDTTLAPFGPPSLDDIRGANTTRGNIEVKPARRSREASLRGPELPPCISAHPERGREALRLIELADAALSEFEKLVTVGMFKVTFSDEERARDLADHAFKLAETAKETPKTELWIQFGDDWVGRRNFEPLPQFFAQSSRGRRHYNGVLKKFKGELSTMRSICVRELAKADAREERSILRRVVTELQ